MGKSGPGVYIVLNYGCVLFDSPQNPEDGGWASAAGAAAKRINGPGDLAMDTIWLTNIDYGEFYRSGIGTYPHLRMDAFLKTTVSQIQNELGIANRDTPTQQSVSIVSEIFNRVALIMQRDFGVEIKEYKSLKDEIAARCRVPAPFISEEFHDACKMATQGYSSVPTKPLKGARSIGLRKNRLAHTIEVCSVPVPTDQFKLYKGAFIAPEKGRVDKICSLPEPAIANISIKHIDNDMLDLLAFGSVPSRNRKQAVVRDWVSQPELMMLKDYAEITVHSAYIGSGWQTLNSRVLIDPLPMDYLSYSYGIVAENFRIAHSSETPRGKGGYMSPQALWLGAVDRFWSFIMAAKLAAGGLTISGYGSGAVNVQTTPSGFNDVMRVGHAMELTFPLYLPRAALEADILEEGGE
jgi:hypothetical protein